MALTVADSVRVQLANLAARPAAEHDVLIGILESAPAALKPTALVAAITEKLGLPEPLAQDLVLTLLSLYTACHAEGKDPETFATDLTTAMQYTEEREEDRRKLSVLTRRLVQVHAPFGVMAKARMLMGRTPNLALASTITTDIRPVFPGSNTDAPSAYFFVHLLRFKMNDGQIDEVHVALDSETIAELKAAIERTEKKMRSIEARLVVWGEELVK